MLPERLHPEPDGLPARPARLPARAWLWLVGGLLVLSAAVVAIFWPALKGEFVSDDYLLILAHGIFREPDGLVRIWQGERYAELVPVLHTSWWLQFKFIDTDYWWWHMVTLLEHVACVWLVVTLLVRAGLRWTLALAVGALFALHPLNASSAAWISEQKNTLSMFFMLLSMHAYLGADQAASRGAGRAGVKTALWLLLALLGFAAALACKISVAPLAGVFVLWHLFSRPTPQWKRLAWTLPFFLIAIIAAKLAVADWTAYVEPEAQEAVLQRPFAQRFGHLGVALPFYLEKSLWPARLAWAYPDLNLQFSTLRSAVIVLLLLPIGIWLWLRRGRPWARWSLLLIGCYLGMLLPCLGILANAFFGKTPVADHWQYHASPFLWTGVVLLLWLAARQLVARTGRAAMVALGMAVPVVLWSVFCLVQTRQVALTYAQPDRLWQKVLEANPKSGLPYLQTGGILHRRGRVAEAMTFYRKAIEREPHVYHYWYQVGIAASDLGDLPTAIAAMERAVELEPRRETLQTLGEFYQSVGDMAKAEATYRRLMQAPRITLEHRLKLPALLAHTGKYQEALSILEDLNKENPDNAVLLHTWGDVMLMYAESLPAGPEREQAAAKGSEYVFKSATLTEFTVPEFLDTFGRAWLLRGDVAKARGVWEKALETARRSSNTRMITRLEERLAAHPLPGEAPAPREQTTP